MPWLLCFSLGTKTGTHAHLVWDIPRIRRGNRNRGCAAIPLDWPLAGNPQSAIEKFLPGWQDRPSECSLKLRPELRGQTAGAITRQCSADLFLGNYARKRRAVRRRRRRIPAPALARSGFQARGRRGGNQSSGNPRSLPALRLCARWQWQSRLCEHSILCRCDTSHGRTAAMNSHPVTPCDEKSFPWQSVNFQFEQNRVYSWSASALSFPGMPGRLLTGMLPERFGQTHGEARR